jgi:hypothetical protein
LCLSDFPILEQELIALDPWDFIVLDRFPDYVVSSGGTSGRNPSITFRNIEEYQAAHHYLTGMDPIHWRESRTIDDFTIDIFFNTNGYYWRKPPGWPMLSIRLEQRGHADMIKELIRRGVVVQGRSIPARRVQCQNGPLRALTGYFWIQEFFPRDFGITALYGYGSHISKVWRNRLKQVWSDELHTSYGLSEFAVGNARWCGHCGSYHYWTAWPEFLALDRTGPITEGDAILLLTSLVPFTQVQPRIRYLTGDIVTVMGDCAVAGLPSFRFRGRVASSVVGRDGNRFRVLLSEIEMLEVLDQLADINCQAHYCEGQLWSDPDLPRPSFPMGLPRFRINAPTVLEEGSEIDVAVETSFDPALNEARAGEIRERFAETIYRDFPRLVQDLAVRGATMNLRLLAPGTLRLFLKEAA